MRSGGAAGGGVIVGVIVGGSEKLIWQMSIIRMGKIVLEWGKWGLDGENWVWMEEERFGWGEVGLGWEREKSGVRE